MESLFLTGGKLSFLTQATQSREQGPGKWNDGCGMTQGPKKDRWILLKGFRPPVTRGNVPVTVYHVILGSTATVCHSWHMTVTCQAMCATAQWLQNGGGKSFGETGARGLRGVAWGLCSPKPHHAMYTPRTPGHQHCVKKEHGKNDSVSQTHNQALPIRLKHRSSPGSEVSLLGNWEWDGVPQFFVILLDQWRAPGTHLLHRRIKLLWESRDALSWSLLVSHFLDQKHKLPKMEKNNNKQID